MITEDYVSFEIAKLLKEKGFDEQCYAYYNIFYDNDGKDLKLWRKYPHRAQPNTNYLNVPTLQTAMKWLREEHKLEVRSTYDYDKDSWWGHINPMFEETDGNSDIYQKALRFDYQGKSYEEACDAAIKYCIENLI